MASETGGSGDGRDRDPAAGTAPADARRETEAERLDRNFDELLQELRVSQAGTQILFAFLLGVSFTTPFQHSGPFVHLVYSVTLLLCVIATALFIAPVALHRTLFGRGRKGPLVKVSSRLALAGLHVLLLAISGAVLLALDNPLGRPMAVTLAIGAFLVLILLWVVLPARLRAQHLS
jgi:uncharacterized membrane protein